MDYEKWLGPGCAELPKQPIGVWSSFEIAQQLKGRPVDEIVFYILSGFNPSYIRIIPHDGSYHLDARTGRITIYLDEEEKISCIKQEMSFDVGREIGSGSGLMAALKYGMDDPRTKWQNMECESIMCGCFGTYKILEDGTKVPYPEVEE